MTSPWSRRDSASPCRAFLCSSAKFSWNGTAFMKRQPESQQMPFCTWIFVIFVGCNSVEIMTRTSRCLNSLKQIKIHHLFENSPKSPLILQPEKTSKYLSMCIHGQGGLWAPAHPTVEVLKPLKFCRDLTAFNSHSRQKDAFDSELSLIKLNKNRHSRLKWALRRHS